MTWRGAVSNSMKAFHLPRERFSLRERFSYMTLPTPARLFHGALERRQISRILDTSVSIRYDAEAAGSGDATTPRNMMNSPTLSGVRSPTR